MLADVYAATGAELQLRATASATLAANMPDRSQTSNARVQRRFAGPAIAAGAVSLLESTEKAGPAEQRLAALLKSNAVDFSQQVCVCVCVCVCVVVWRGVCGRRESRACQ